MPNTDVHTSSVSDVRLRRLLDTDPYAVDSDDDYISLAAEAQLMT